MICKICGEPAPDPKKYMKIGPWVFPLCDKDHLLVKQFVTNVGNIRDVLATAGIHIGVPKGAKFIQKKVS